MPLPHPPGFDRTRSFLRAPYTFIGKTCGDLGSDFFETRLFLHRTICLRGQEAADLFCDRARFGRRDPSPGGLLLTLPSHSGQGDATQLAQNTLRSSLFDTLGLAYARRLFAEEWALTSPWWALQGRVVLYGELQTVLTRVACAWTGVPLPEADVQKRTNDLALLLDPLASMYDLTARRARTRVDAWLGGLIRAGRAGGSLEPHSALDRLARSKLDQAAAANQLCKVLKPMAALSGDVVFLALALHQYPHLAPTTSEERRAFIQEVRRFFPSLPVAVARVRRDFEWRGATFSAGQRTFLDLHGTNHHPAVWHTPSEFQPERFADTPPRSHARLISRAEREPHGPRREEELILTLLDEALLQLTVFMRYRVVPSQDLGLDMRRAPAVPRSHLILDEIQARTFAGSQGRQIRQGSHVRSEIPRNVG